VRAGYAPVRNGYVRDISVLSDLKKFVLRPSRRRVRHGKAAGGEDLANAGDSRGDISPHEIPLDNPAHQETQRRQDVEQERLSKRPATTDDDAP
jgi:hypothetical protein